MRTLFIGGTRRGYLTLRALVDDGADLVGVISLRQDEHESDRYEEQIARLARKHGIPCYETKWLKDRDYAALIAQEIRPEIAFVVGCRILLPPEIYTLPPRGTLAVHDSLLPEYRGFAPLNWSIINGESRTGVTLFYLSDAMDGGDIVAQKEVPIGPFDEAPEVYERSCSATAELVVEWYPALADGTAPRLRRQEYTEGSFTCSRTPNDGLIDWNDATAVIHNKIRALAYPYPGAFTYFETKKLYVWRARPVPDAPTYVGRITGRVVHVDRGEGAVDVLTGDGVLRVQRVQWDGETEAARAADVIRSVKARLGVYPETLLPLLSGIERRLEQLERQSSLESRYE